MRIPLLLLCALCLLAATTGSQSHPSLSGPTGMGVLPNAGAYMPEQPAYYAQASYDYFSVGNTSSVPVRYLFGGKRLEVGYGGDMAKTTYPIKFSSNDTSSSNTSDNTASDDSSDDPVETIEAVIGCLVIAGVTVDSLYVAPYYNSDVHQYNGKYRIIAKQNGDGLAFGLRHGATQLTGPAPITANQCYLVYTTTLHRGTRHWARLRGSVGVNETFIFQQNQLSFQTMRPFGGIEAYLSRRVYLAADMQGPAAPLDSAPMASLVLHVQPAHFLNLSLGMTNMADDGVSGLQHYHPYVGLAFNWQFGSRAHHTAKGAE